MTHYIMTTKLPITIMAIQLPITIMAIKLLITIIVPNCQSFWSGEPALAVVGFTFAHQSVVDVDLELVVVGQLLVALDIPDCVY